MVEQYQATHVIVMVCLAALTHYRNVTFKQQKRTDEQHRVLNNCAWGRAITVEDDRPQTPTVRNSRVLNCGKQLHT